MQVGEGADERAGHWCPGKAGALLSVQGPIPWGSATAQLQPVPYPCHLQAQELRTQCNASQLSLGLVWVRGH